MAALVLYFAAILFGLVSFFFALSNASALAGILLIIAVICGFLGFLAEKL